jgi:hypothetical protein
MSLAQFLRENIYKFSPPVGKTNMDKGNIFSNFANNIMVLEPWCIDVQKLSYVHSAFYAYVWW